MLIEQGLVRQMLIWLSDQYESWVRNPSVPALTLHERVVAAYQRITTLELEEITSKGKNFSTGQRFILLRPIEKQGVVEPVVSVAYDFSHDVPEIHLQVAIFSLDDQGKALRAIGFRFETPESTGDHNYYHSQLITHFRTPVDPSRAFCDYWLPTSYPAFVIDSTNVVTFFICVILSLYGRTSEADLLQSKFARELKKYHAALGWQDTEGHGRKSRLVQDKQGRWFVRLP